MYLQVCCADSVTFLRQWCDLLADNKPLLPELTLADGLLPAIEQPKPGMLRLRFPGHNEQQMAALREVIVRLPGVSAVVALPKGLAADEAFSQIIATDEAMRQLLEQARKMAMLNAPLLISGDTGTGKDVLAWACHQASPRRDKPYLALNCAAIPEQVVESELFGHAPGAYPNALEGKKGFFEQANGGSVLLDEIGEMSAGMQAKLLRFLNNGIFRRVGEDSEVQVDVRVICATQKNLEVLVQQGMFREELYYRLKVLTLELPALCHRVKDIMPLAEHFIADFADEQGIAAPRVADDVPEKLVGYSWPGNVRQLKNTLYSALAQLEGDELTAQDIQLPELDHAGWIIHHTALSGSLEQMMRCFERAVLIRLYRDYPSTRKLARRLNVSHTAVANKLRDYGIRR